VARFLLPLISLIALISLIFNAKFILQNKTQIFRVIEVIDGDTFKIDFDGGQRVRLLGVNAPELERCLGAESKAKLAQLVLGNKVTLSDQFTDPYGRIIANVFMGQTYVNREMAASGFVRLDYTANPRRDELKAVYHHDDRCLSVKPPDPKCVIKGNVDNEKPYKTYLLPGCRNYTEAKIDLSTEDQWFCSEAEAKTAGFIKSSTCP
jgi:hypothetical protein